MHRPLVNVRILLDAMQWRLDSSQFQLWHCHISVLSAVHPKPLGSTPNLLGQCVPELWKHRICCRFQEAPRAKDKALMPTFPSRQDKMRAHQQHSPDPRIVDARRAQLGRAAETGGLFSFA